MRSAKASMVGVIPQQGDIHEVRRQFYKSVAVFERRNLLSSYARVDHMRDHRNDLRKLEVDIPAGPVMESASVNSEDSVAESLGEMWEARTSAKTEGIILEVKTMKRVGQLRRSASVRKV